MCALFYYLISPSRMFTCRGEDLKPTLHHLERIQEDRSMASCLFLAQLFLTTISKAHLRCQLEVAFSASPQKQTSPGGFTPSDNWGLPREKSACSCFLPTLVKWDIQTLQVITMEHLSLIQPQQMSTSLLFLTWGCPPDGRTVWVTNRDGWKGSIIHWFPCPYPVLSRRNYDP